jgi:regulator of RNase E activity RraB
MKEIEKAVELGYDVTEATEIIVDDGKTLKVYAVKGWGMNTQYTESQEDMWKWLVLPEAHEHRVNMWKHNDPGDLFTMTDDEIFESSTKAALAADMIDEDEAKEMREARESALSNA